MVQIHCHHHAVLDPDAERKLLARLGVEADILPSGCCGMAGSFGFEAGKYTVSQQIAAQGLLPALAAAPADTPVLADGFSCREQIEQATGRRTLHVAEFIAQAL
jgi:Fe-S oxidoreductase